MIEIIDCEEFGVIGLGIDRLLVDGEISLDSRIVDKGFLNISLVKGQVVFRADRHVGLIPVNDRVAIRVKPRAQIANIAHMIVKSGIAPTAIPDFSRGYLPKFETGPDIEKIYFGPLIGAIERIVSAGMMKSYVPVPNPPAWCGRLLISDTIKRHRARNIRYRSEFDYRTLSYGGPENVALKQALRSVRSWLAEKDHKNQALARADRLLQRLEVIPDYHGDISVLVQKIGHSAGQLPAHYGYYRDPLWTAYLLLQHKLPDVSTEGFIALDSLIVDLSKVFEAYVRRILLEKANDNGWRIVDGNRTPYTFFTDDNAFHVQPDIVVLADGKPAAVLDVKYKPEPKESDRYEVLAFMDTVGVQMGGFICPQRDGSTSRYMGTTAGGKELSLLRFDLSAGDIEAEAERFIANVAKLVSGNYTYA